MYVYAFKCQAKKVIQVLDKL